MKRFSLFIPLIALLALAPLPALACGGGGGGGEGASSGPKPSDPAYEGFKTAQDFFGFFFGGKGNLFVAAVLTSDSFRHTYRGETWDEEVQRKYVESVVAERKRREAERAERERNAKNWAAGLPGLDD